MKKLWFNTFLLCFLCSFSSETAAEGFSGNIAVTSDYVFRGETQTDGGPALQGGVEWGAKSGFHIGAWGSNVDFNDSGEASLELNLQAGYTFRAFGVSYSIEAIQYRYPKTEKALGYDFTEIGGRAVFDLRGGNLSLGIARSGDSFGNSEKAFIYEGILSSPPWGLFSAEGGLTLQDTENTSVLSWFAQGVLTAGSTAVLLTYTSGQGFKNRAVLSIEKTF